MINNSILDLRGVVIVENNKYENNKQITKIIIGNTIKEIKNGAFLSCLNLKEIIFEEPCQLKEISGVCFFNCKSLRKIDIPESVEIIQSGAFSYCFLETVILRGVKKISSSNFNIFMMKYLAISDKIENLDKYSFCGIKNNDEDEDEDEYEQPEYVKVCIKEEYHELMKTIFSNQYLELNEYQSEIEIVCK
jgi:hypothetical protein